MTTYTNYANPANIDNRSSDSLPSLKGGSITSYETKDVRIHVERIVRDCQVLSVANVPASEWFDALLCVQQHTQINEILMHSVWKLNSF